MRIEIHNLNVTEYGSDETWIHMHLIAHDVSPVDLDLADALEALVKDLRSGKITEQPLEIKRTFKTVFE